MRSLSLENLGCVRVLVHCVLEPRDETAPQQFRRACDSRVLQEGCFHHPGPLCRSDDTAGVSFWVEEVRRVVLDRIVLQKGEVQVERLCEERRHGCAGGAVETARLVGPLTRQVENKPFPASFEGVTEPQLANDTDPVSVRHTHRTFANRLEVVFLLHSHLSGGITVWREMISQSLCS